MIIMKKTFIIFLAAGAVGCARFGNKEADKVDRNTQQIIEISEDNLEVITIEGCEYFILKSTPDANQAFGFMAHKGNCSNPIHPYNPESETPDQ